MQRRLVWVELREREMERREDFHSVLEFESYDFTLQIVSETVSQVELHSGPQLLKI